MMTLTSFENVFQSVLKEAIRQDTLHLSFWDGFPENSDILPVLLEEVGEVAKSLNEDDLHELYNELIQVSTVSLRWAQRVGEELALDQVKDG